MVLHSINRIKSSIPDVVHVMMFYNDGTVFQSTFEGEELNIPKLGGNFGELITSVKNIIEQAKLGDGIYEKLIFQTRHAVVVVIHLGEDSNVALFMRNTGKQELRFDSIKEHLLKLEKLIDMDVASLKEKTSESR